MNLDIAYYFVNNLETPHNSTWQHIGGPFTHTIYNLVLNPNYQWSAENTRKIMFSFIKQVDKYTGRNETGKDGRLHLLYSSSEINLHANSIYNHLDLCYTTLLIDFRRQTQGDNAVSRSTVSVAFRRLLPKTKKN